MRHFTKYVILTTAAFLLGGASAQALTATQIVEKEVEITLPDGATDIAYQDASLKSSHLSRAARADLPVQ